MKWNKLLLWHRNDIFQWWKVEWNLRLLKSSVRISCSIEMLSLNNERLKKWNPSLLKSSMRNKTHLPYSCGIEIIFFNDERLKNWNPNLSKSSICIVYSISFQFGWIWTKLTYLTLVASKGSDHLAHSWVKKFEGQRSTGPAPRVHLLCSWGGLGRFLGSQWDRQLKFSTYASFLISWSLSKFELI